MMLQMKIKMKRHQDWKNENQKVKAAIYTALSHIQEGCCSDGVQVIPHLFLLLIYFLAQLYDDLGV